MSYDVALAHRVYSEIVLPLMPALAGAQEVIIVPDDVLNYLPFESLALSPALGRTDGRLRYAEYRDVQWLAREFTIVYAVSATSLEPELGNKKPVPGSLVAFAEPLTEVETSSDKPALRGSASALALVSSLSPLRQVREEVESVARLMGRRVSVVELKGREASEKAFLKLAPDAGYLHFAVHSVVDEVQPEYSMLVLAAEKDSDGFLQAFEIVEAQLNARLVTLSSCQTALGKMMKGEGLLGLKRAFLLAGARSILVTFWNIEDSTAEFMEEFYRSVSDGNALPVALKQAKLAYMQRTRAVTKQMQLSLSHPFFWAPFTLTVASDY